jgi:hypothetical protein
MASESGKLKPVPLRTYGKCEVCKQDFAWSEDSIMMARIQRGWFRNDEQDGGIEESNVKAELWLCVDCYLKNPLLCAFFNSIGWRV